MSLFEQFITPAETQEQSPGTMMGITLAEVTNIDDPENLGRVKCKFITANEDALEMDWAFVMTPFGGNDCGFFFMPNVKDTVLVLFENGDIRRPYVIGSLWGSLVTPPLKLNGGKNETYQIKTPNKSIIELSDIEGKETITLKTPKERQVVLNDEKQLVELSDGNNSLSLDSKNGEIKIKCKQKLTIEVGNNAKITIDGMSGNIKIEGQQAINLEGAQIEINAKAKATFKGSAQVSVESGGMTSVKGGILKLN
ncbi:MAG: phage baseplate assembly protein V [Desulfitobacteriaceae bacterium]|nr:phage baseplate assembly protein V [Desulfitobacteriaceae bacterium]